MLQVSARGMAPVRSTSSPARMCHHTSPSVSGAVARGSTVARKKPTTAAVAAATPAVVERGLVPGPCIWLPSLRWCARAIWGTSVSCRCIDAPTRLAADVLHHLGGCPPAGHRRARPDRAAARLARLPTPFWLFTLTLAGVLVGITVTKGVQDPDFFWHLTAGQWMADHGQVPSTDPFSFTWAGQPWTPHEWLSELLMYWLVSGVGRTGALFAFGLFPAAIVISQGLMLSRQGVSLRAFALPAVLIGLVITPYVTLRPQAVSWLFLSLLIWFLLELKPERPWRALLLIPFFVLWANLHGVYVIGLGVVATYCLFTIIGRTPMSQAKRPLAVAAIGCLLASMVTPAGPIGILYPFRYVELSDWGLANIQEWQSPSFHEPAHWAFAGLIVWVGLNRGRNTPGWLVMLSWVGIAMGLLALRNVPIAAVFCLPTLALGMESRLRERAAQRAKEPKQASSSVAARPAVAGDRCRRGDPHRRHDRAGPAWRGRRDHRQHRQALPGAEHCAAQGR